LSPVVQGRAFGSGGDEDFAFLFFGGCFEGVGLGSGLDLILDLHSDLDLNLDLVLDWVLGNAGDTTWKGGKDEFWGLMASSLSWMEDLVGGEDSGLVGD
jgi:hypothetical protein